MNQPDAQPPLAVPAYSPQFASTDPGGYAKVSFIIGLVGLLLGWLPILGLLLGATAIVLCVLAVKNGQSKRLAASGAILGAAAVIASIIVTVLLVNLVNSVGSYA